MPAVYQIIKENLKDPKSKVLLVDSHSEVIECDTLDEAQDICDIFNANSTDSKYYIREVNI